MSPKKASIKWTLKIKQYTKMDKSNIIHGTLLPESISQDRPGIGSHDVETLRQEARSFNISLLASHFSHPERSSLERR